MSGITGVVRMTRPLMLTILSISDNRQYRVLVLDDEGLIITIWVQLSHIHGLIKSKWFDFIYFSLNFLY